MRSTSGAETPEPLRPGVSVRSVDTFQQPVGGAGEREAAQVGAAVRPLLGEGVEDRGGGEVAGAVVEKLARERAGGAVGVRFDGGDAARRLDDAVEAAALGPGAGESPGAELGDHEAGMTVGEVLRREAEAGERAGPVAEQDDVGAREELLEATRARVVAQVEEGAPLAEQRVGGRPRLEVREVRRVEPQHVRAEGAEVAAADRPGDHPGQVEDPHARRGQRRAVVETRCAVEIRRMAG